MKRRAFCEASIGSAALTALALFSAYSSKVGLQVTGIDLDSALQLVGRGRRGHQLGKHQTPHRDPRLCLGFDAARKRVQQTPRQIPFTEIEQHVRQIRNNPMIAGITRMRLFQNRPCLLQLTLIPQRARPGSRIVRYTRHVPLEQSTHVGFGLGAKEFVDKFVKRFGMEPDYWGGLYYWSSLQHFQQAIEKAEKQ